MDIKEAIKKYLTEELISDESVKAEILADDNLELSELVDSLSIVKLIVFLENEFSVSLDSELELSNFDSVNSMCAMIERIKKESAK